MAKLPAYLKKLSVRELLKAGAHFGHKASNTHPRMLPYVHSKRSSVHIIDVKKTVKGIVEACFFLAEMSRQKKQMLIVGTKRQHRNAVEAEAKRLEIPYVSERWPGGLLTNYATIKQSIKKLEKITELETSGQINMLTKKERALMGRKKKKLQRDLGGILNLTKLPDVLIVVDPGMEHNAVCEAKKIGAKVVAIIDTDTDPAGVDVVIPCNDDSANVVEYILRFLGDSIIHGRGGEPPSQEKIEEETAEVAK